MNRLGWLHAPQVFRNRVAEMHAFAEGVRQDRIRHVVLCGMGGASLAAEVFASVFAPRVGFPKLLVLDSTDPEAIAAVERRIDLAATLFLVASKSGTTLETECLRLHFARRLEEKGVRPVGSRFAAVTDPGSALAAVAEEQGFRAVFENPPDIGGRYSALSFFGLVPAALLGLDLERLLDAADREAADCLPDGDRRAAALELGAAMGRLAQEGVDKLTLRCSPEIAPFGAWVEQLVAESTGKDGMGVVPVLDEPPHSHQGRDRFYVDLELRGDAHRAGRIDPAPRDAPRAWFSIDDAYELGALFLRFEMATALAGAVLRVNPIDEPNVAEAKDATNAVLTEPPRAEPVLASARGLAICAPRPVADALRVGLEGSVADPGAWLRAHLERTAVGDYVAILAYVHRTSARHAVLQEIRAAVGRRASAATTLGYGPRYLHSTGQLHKGGAANGVFLLLLADEPAPAGADDVPIPGKPFGFARLFAAQGEGDFRTLARRGRRVLAVRLARPLDESLAALRDAIR